MASRYDHLSRLVDDPYLEPHLDALQRRREYARDVEKRLTSGTMTLADFANGHEYYGLHRRNVGWVFTEWMPNANAAYLVGSFSDWRESDGFALQRIDGRGNWQIRLPHDALRHGNRYRVRIHWASGQGDRIPAYARRVVQEPKTAVFSAQVWCPDPPYQWQYPAPGPPKPVPLIYEAHVGIAQQREGIGTYTEFRDHILPRIVDAGYNTIQLMAIMEHPYYASFGYQVSNFFAASSWFGTPDELKALIDAAHGAGLTVIMDLIHSHAVKNEIEGLSRFDGTPYQYFHDGERGVHPAWDSRCFDYGKVEVLHFLLSNCRFWLDEYHVDGFRFDGVTSMLYTHHGLGTVFTSYNQHFDESVDDDALAYLSLANKLIHRVNPEAITVAEDVSGMPGLGAPIEDGGRGFDYRMAMGIPDCWFTLASDVPDEDWDLAHLWHKLTDRRSDERTISYVESHDQAIVGGKTMIFQLLDTAMYDAMRISDTSPVLDRGIALHKMIRLATIMTAGHGYLNFIGNEFGHPEWIDFPREGNNWSFRHARRQWHLRDDPSLKYQYLAHFDREMLRLVGSHRSFAVTEPRVASIVDADKIFAFERDGLLLVFNFHPARSVSDYHIGVPPGEYHLMLDTDERRFGGQNRLTADQRYFSQPLKDGDRRRHSLSLYMPCRTALVLRKESG